MKKVKTEKVKTERAKTERAKTERAFWILVDGQTTLKGLFVHVKLTKLTAPSK